MGMSVTLTSFSPFEFDTLLLPSVIVITQSLDMLFSLITVALGAPASWPSFLFRISLSVFSRFCLSLISSAKKLVSVILSLMSNFLTDDISEGDRDRLPLEYRRLEDGRLGLLDRCLERPGLRLRSGEGLL